MREVASDELKRRAAVRAADWIRDGMVLGLGTGSTARHLLTHIAERRAAGEWRSIIGIPTSEATARLARELGIPLTDLAAHPRIDLAIDGADEVDPELRLIKGLGGALLREKIVGTAAREVIIIVDESKRVDVLGTRAPVPVEVDPFGAPIQEPFLRSLGGEPCLRRRADGSPYRTDGGNYLIDCRFAGGIADAAALDVRLNSRPGVMENGLFIGIATRAVVASAGGIEVLTREGSTT